jgi:hypothetical protein
LLPNHLSVKIAADKDQLIIAGFFRKPGLPGPSVQDHMNPLEDEATGSPIEIKDALAAEHISSVLLGELVYPLVEELAIDHTIKT